MRAAGLILWLGFLAPATASSEEAFPGQNCLAAGLACYRNLDMECARTRLEEALGEFSPERDEHFFAHVREARTVLAMIHVAADDLARAEAEFRTLLVLDPGYQLPPGDHPPKVRYILQQARATLDNGRKASAQVSPRPLKEPGGTEPVPDPPRVHKPRASRTPLGWGALVEARWVSLFGDDTRALGSGPGTALGISYRSAERWKIQLQLAYVYHPSAKDGPALQALSLVSEALYEIEAGAFCLRSGGGLGVLAMGTEDRYDHWGLVLRASVALSWPTDGLFALLAGLHPSVVFTAGGASFYLPVGVSGEIRW